MDVRLQNKLTEYSLIEFMNERVTMAGVTINISLLFSYKPVLYCHAQGHEMLFGGKYRVNSLQEYTVNS